MKHASSSTLKKIAPLLIRIRSLPKVVEKKPGIFYRKSAALLHFHEDPAGLYADIKTNAWRRLPVNTRLQQDELIKQLRKGYASGK